MFFSFRNLLKKSNKAVYRNIRLAKFFSSFVIISSSLTCSSAFAVQAVADMGQSYPGLGYGASVLELILQNWQNPDLSTQGSTSLIVRIAADGRPFSCEIKKFSSSPTTDNSICNAVARIGTFPRPSTKQNTEIALTFQHSPVNYGNGQGIGHMNGQAIQNTQNAQSSLSDASALQQNTAQGNQKEPISPDSLIHQDNLMQQYSQDVFEQARKAMQVPVLSSGTYESVVKVDISPTGALQGTTIQTSSGSSELDKAILRTLNEDVIYPPTPTQTAQSLWLTFTVKK